MSNICDFDRILKTECNLQHFTRNCRIKNLDDFERNEADAYMWRAGLLNVKEKGITISYIMNRCLVMFLRGGKVNILKYWWNIIAKLKVNKWSSSKWMNEWMNESLTFQQHLHLYPWINIYIRDTLYNTSYLTKHK